jgi:predicted secreted protein
VTKNQLDYPEYRRFCRELIMPVADMLEMLSRKGARIGAVGVVGSPSCGVSTTSVGYLGGRVQKAEHLQVSGRGIFMEELASELCIRKIAVDWGEVANLPPGSEQLGSG